MKSVRFARAVAVMAVVCAAILHLYCYKWHINICLPVIGSLHMNIPADVESGTDIRYAEFAIEGLLNGSVYVRERQAMWQHDGGTGRMSVWRVIMYDCSSLFEMDTVAGWTILSVNYGVVGVILPFCLLALAAYCERSRVMVALRWSVVRIWRVLSLVYALIATGCTKVTAVLRAKEYSRRDVAEVVLAAVALVAHLILFKWCVRIDLPYVSTDDETLNIVTSTIPNDIVIYYWNHWLGFIDGDVHNRSSLYLEWNEYLWGGIYAPLVLLLAVVWLERRRIFAGIITVGRGMQAMTVRVQRRLDAIEQSQRPKVIALLLRWLSTTTALALFAFVSIIVVPSFLWCRFVWWYYVALWDVPWHTPWFWYALPALPVILAVAVGGYGIFGLSRDTGVVIKRRIWYAGFVCMLLSYGAYQQRWDMWQYRLLKGIYGCWQEWYDPRWAIEHGDVPRLVGNIRSSGDVEQVTYDYDGKTLLHYAAKYGTIETVDCLLEHGSRVNARDRFGETPLWRAVERRDTQIINRLLERGATLAADTATHRTIVQTAIQEPVQFNRIRRMIVRLENQDETRGIEVIRILAAHGADVNATTAFQPQTPLQKAREYQQERVAACLIALGAE